MAKKKFYAVRVGKQPGIYESWDECKEQVNGYPGAEYQGFPRMEEAQAFMNPQKEVATPAASAAAPIEKSAEKPKSAQVDIPDGPYAFVDGSFNADTGVYGYGGFLVNGGARYSLLGSGSKPDMSAMRNVSGEVLGAMAAVKKAEELGIKNLTILYDYQGIESWANGSWKTNKTGTRDYKDFMESPDRTVNVSFQKVKGHTGVEGNEIADVMAKYAVGVSLTGPQQARLDKALKDATQSTSRRGLDLDMPDDFMESDMAFE